MRILLESFLRGRLTFSSITSYSWSGNTRLLSLFEVYIFIRLGLVEQNLTEEVLDRVERYFLDRIPTHTHLNLESNKR